MIKFQILSLFPNYFQSTLEEGLVAKAIKNKLIEIHLINPRDFSKDKARRVDDYPFGGGDSMIMSYQPLESSLNSLEDKGRVVFLTPSGKLWDHEKTKNYAKNYKTLTLICGRYGGIDQRFIKDYVDEEVSIGDYVLNGGEVACLVLLESLFRFIPGSLGNEKSSIEESFEKEGLLECPQWTRPQTIGFSSIPKVILSGNHQSIKQFRYYSSLVITSIKRPDLLKKNKKLLKELPIAQKELAKLSLEDLQSLNLHPRDLKLVLT